MTLILETGIFALLTLVLMLAGVAEAARGAEMRDSLRLAFAGGLFSLALAMGYETFALDTHRRTISRIAFDAFNAYPGIWLVTLGVIALLFGALAWHFTGASERFGPNTGWVVVAYALVLVAAGAGISRVTGWIA